MARDYSLREFANVVNDSCRLHGGFFEHLFSHKLFALLKARFPSYMGKMTAERFRADLLAANKAGLISLERCDLAAAYPAEDVRHAEIRQSTSSGHDLVFHFVGAKR